MTNFFESENVMREMTTIYELQKELYGVIQKFPYMSSDAKWEHIETLKELLEKHADMGTIFRNMHNVLVQMQTQLRK